MRGEKTTEAEKARQLIINAADEAKVVLKEADRKKHISSAIILGPNGEPLFHIVSTWWSRVVVMGFGLLMLIMTLMAGMVFYNQLKISALENRVDTDKVETDKKIEDKK